MDVYFEQYKPASSIANYLTVGSKTNGDQSLGFELEHFVVEQGTLEAVPYSVDTASSAPSIEKILERIKVFYDESIYENDGDGSSRLFGLGRDRIAITLEPGAQLEVSIGPAHSLREIEQLYQDFRRELDPILGDLGLQLLELGYHPTRQARELPLLPKHRYNYMDEYFTQTGKHGICMMRATASTQVSVDFSSESDAISKFRIANALGPLLSFVTDNSPIFESEEVGACGGSKHMASSGLAVPYRMARMACWDDTDPQRSLVARGGFDEDYSFLRYAETLVESPGIFLPSWNEANGTPQYLGFSPFKSVLPNEFLSEEMILHILSLFFYDTRFKTYLELRQADSLPLEYALSYVALVSGIFYNSAALKYFSDRFLYTDSTSVAYAKSALRKKGYDADVYGRRAYTWLDEMMQYAREGLAPEDAPYLTPLAKLVSKRKTLLECACKEKVC